MDENHAHGVDDCLVEPKGPGFHLCHEGTMAQNGARFVDFFLIPMETIVEEFVECMTWKIERSVEY